MRLCELTMSERESLDKINSINLELEKSQVQSLANVVWAYLHEKIDKSLFTSSKTEIKKKLKEINKIAPKITTYDCK
jgi:hypothetical protein